MLEIIMIIFLIALVYKGASIEDRRKIDGKYTCDHHKYFDHGSFDRRAFGRW
jgi:hypothetical protein